MSAEPRQLFIAVPASRTVSRRCTSTLTVTNAATALSSVRGTVNHTKTKSPSSACRKTLITAATRFLVEDCRVRVRLNNQAGVKHRQRRSVQQRTTGAEAYVPHHQPCPPASSLSAGPRGGVIMLILKNVTAVQLHPRKCRKPLISLSKMM